MDGGAWWAAVHGVARSRTQLSDFTFTFHFHALEKEMTTHSSVLAWRIPGTEEPGGLPSMGSHRVGHDWSDLAAAANSTSQGRGIYIIKIFKGRFVSFHLLNHLHQYEVTYMYFRTILCHLSIILLPKLFQLWPLGAFKLALLSHMPSPFCNTSLLSGTTCQSHLVLSVWNNGQGKKKKLVSPLGFCHRAPNSLSISLLTGLSFILMRWLLVLPRWELVTRKTKSCLKA